MDGVENLFGSTGGRATFREKELGEVDGVNQEVIIITAEMLSLNA